MLNNQKNYKSTQSNVNEKYYNSWRTDVVEVEPNGVTDHAFLTTKPNLIYIKNPNNTYLYFGLKAIPTPDKYEFQILPHSYDTFGQPNGTGHLYIYNPTPNKIFIEVYSQYDEFNIAILKNYSLAVNEVKVQGEFEYKSGYQLPSGVNEIGKVALNNSQFNNLTSAINLIKRALIGNKDADNENLLTFIDGVETSLNELSTGGTVNGKTNLFDLKYLLNEINKNILNNNGCVWETSDIETLNTNLTVIRNALNVIEADTESNKQYLYNIEECVQEMNKKYNTVSASRDGELTIENVEHIVLVKNDSETDLLIMNIVNEDDSESTFNILVGEQFTDLNIKAKNITLTGVSRIIYKTV